jgi:hypothetical protein
MITNFEKQTQDLTSEEMNRVLPLVVRGLNSHVGKSNAISSSDIKKALKTKYNINLYSTRLRKIVNYLRINDIVPFLCSCGKGYYIGTNEDVLNTIQSLNERISSMQNVVNSLKRQINKQYDI